MKKVYFLFLLLCLFSIKISNLNAAIKSVAVNATNFDPSYFYVNVGDVIVWNLGSGGGYHTTTSTVIPNGALAWSALVNPMQSTFSYTVNVGGDYDYTCLSDSSMAVVGHFTVFGTVTGVSEEAPSLSFVHYSYAEKFVTIKCFLPSAGIVHLRLYDLIGKTALIIEPIQPFEDVMMQSFSVATLPKGFYIIELTVGTYKSTRKIIVE